MKDVKTNKKESFEESLEKLDLIVNRLEKGDVPLADAVSLYEQGMQLFQSCNTQLKDIKSKIDSVDMAKF